MVKTNNLMKKAKGTMALGTMSMVGHSVMGSMQSGPASTSTMNSAGAGLNLLNVGNTAKIGMDIFGKNKSTKKSYKLNPVGKMLR